jgi:hypothetical protein
VRTRRIRRPFRIATLLAMLWLIRLARGVRPRWRPLLAGTVLTAAGVLLRGAAWGLVALPGLWFLVYALFVPSGSDTESNRRAELERELAAYSTLAERCDLEATLDRYANDVTYELRDILDGQAMAACSRR